MKTVRLCGLMVVLSGLAALAWAGPATAAITGTVVDQSAHPIEGIEVCAEPVGPLAAPGACARTDAAGEYTIAGLGAGYRVQFYSRENHSPGYAPQWYPGVAHYEEAETITEPEVGAGIDAVMAPGASFLGTVVDHNGRAPIEGVEVCPVSTVFHDRDVTFCARTDATGRFALRGLAGGSYRLAFDTEGDVNYVDALIPEAPDSIPIGAGGTIELEAELRAGIEVKGEVRSGRRALDPLFRVGFKRTDGDVGMAPPEPGDRQASPGFDSIPGLPPGPLYAISFAEDDLEEGLDLHPDGYLRQYWDNVANFDEAALIGGTGGLFGGVNAVLTRGEEGGPLVTEEPGTQVTSTPLVTAPATPVFPIGLRGSLRCKKGFRKVTTAGSARCIRIHKKRKHHHRNRKVHYR